MSLLTNVLKLWRTGQYLLPADSGFMVKHLFANGEPGFAKLDFSGFAGMYQDRARTIPYTAVEQPLGSFTGLNGVAATAPADVNRGKVSARVNYFTESEFPYGLSGAPTRGGNLTATTLAGYRGALHFGEGNVYAYKGNPYLTTTPVVFSVVVLMDDGGAPIVNSTGSGADFMLVVNGGTVIGSVASMGGGLYRITSPVVSSGGNSNTGISKYGGNSGRSFKATAYDIRLATDAHLPYQWVNTATDYDTAGFPHYLAFNGTNTAYATPSIDFTGTDKMTVWAGVTRLSNTPSQMIAEISFVAESQPGSWFLASQYTASYNYYVNSLGVPGNGRVTAHLAAPGVSQDYISFQADLGAPSPADRLKTRRNALASPPNTSDFGYGGTYGNYPLYIGARAGTSLYFNGRIYQLIVRGAESSISQIEATENLIRKTMRLP